MYCKKLCVRRQAAKPALARIRLSAKTGERVLTLNYNITPLLNLAIFL